MLNAVLFGDVICCDRFWFVPSALMLLRSRKP